MPQMKFAIQFKSPLPIAVNSPDLLISPPSGTYAACTTPPQLLLRPTECDMIHVLWASSKAKLACEEVPTSSGNRRCSACN